MQKDPDYLKLFLVAFAAFLTVTIVVWALKLTYYSHAINKATNEFSQAYTSVVTQQKASIHRSQQDLEHKRKQRQALMQKQNLERQKVLEQSRIQRQLDLEQSRRDSQRGQQLQSACLQWRIQQETMRTRTVDQKTEKACSKYETYIKTGEYSP